MNKLYLVYKVDGSDQKAHLVSALSKRSVIDLLKIESPSEYIYEIINNFVDIKTQKVLEISDCLCNKSEFLNLFKRNIIKEKTLEEFIYKEKKIKLETILIIGPPISEGNHFSENIRNALIEKGMTIEYICIHDLKDSRWLSYIRKEEEYSLFDVLKKIEIIPDLILIDECEFHWDDDGVNTPIFYVHREFMRSPSVHHPDVVFFWHDEVRSFFERFFAAKWMKQVPYKENIGVAINPKIYKPKKKKYKGLSGIGFRETLELGESVKEMIKIGNYRILHMEKEEFIKTNCKFFPDPVSTKKYRKILPLCSAIWIPISTQQYIGRRMLEAMACTTLCVIRLENEDHERILKEFGFEKGVHYIGVDKVSEALNAYNETNSKPTMIEKAYNEVMKNHTFKNQAQQIIDTYYKIVPKLLKRVSSLQVQKRFDVICPIYFIEQFFENVKNWVREIPIGKLIIGLGNPHFKREMFLERLSKIVPDNCEIEVIDQRRHKTLGICLTELMKKVTTKWFVFLHSDVEITPFAFEVMKKFMRRDIGIIESERRLFDSPKHNDESTHFAKRAYSGFQLIQMKAIKGLLHKIEDDFIYRNEDLIFQSECVERGFKYIKSWAMHIHQIKKSNWSIREKEAYFMQWKGLVKYTNPSVFTEYACLSAMRKCQDDYGLLLAQVISFTHRTNPNWGKIVIERWCY